MEITITGYITKEYNRTEISIYVEKIEFSDNQFNKLHYDYVISEMPKELNILVNERLYANQYSKEFKNIDELDTEDMDNIYGNRDRDREYIRNRILNSMAVIESLKTGDAITITCLATKEKSYSIMKEDINLLKDFWLYPIQMVLSKRPVRENKYSRKRIKTIIKEYYKSRNMANYTKITKRHIADSEIDRIKWIYKRPAIAYFTIRIKKLITSIKLFKRERKLISSNIATAIITIIIAVVIHLLITRYLN